MNGVNLEQFQFEFDLTWMSFFQDAIGRTYARYGGRDDQNAEAGLTKKSLMRIMDQVLELHKVGDVQKTSIYEPKASGVTTPIEIPTLKKMMAGRKGSSCIHCHDIKNSQLRHLYQQNKLDKSMVFTYPSPGLLGLHVDSDRQNVVARVDRDSPAANAGLRRGDIISSSDDQRILTFADFTRVLEFAPDEGQLELEISRRNKPKSIKIELPNGWKRSQDPSWRPSVSMVGPGGGFWGKAESEQQRHIAGLGQDDLAIRVNFIWAPHAKKAGLKMNDLVISVEEASHDMNMRQFHNWLQLNRNWGDEVTIAVLRGGKRVDLKMNLPTGPME